MEKRYSAKEISEASGAAVNTIYTRAKRIGIRNRGGYTAEEAYLLAQASKGPRLRQDAVEELREYLKRRKYEG